MLWALLSLFTALSQAAKDLLCKKGLCEIDEYAVAWSIEVFSAIFLLPALLFIGIPVLDQTFLLMIVVTALLDTLAAILYMKAIKSSPISLVAPMMMFTPMFLLITSPLILGEFPSVFGLAGIVLIVFGSYMLKIKEAKKGITEPFRALAKEKGPLLMLATAFIWSFTGNFDKIGVEHSNPAFWIISHYLLVSLFLLPLVVMKSKTAHKIPSKFWMLAPIGLIAGLGVLAQMFAITMTIVPYVLSIKRTSVLFSVIFGFFFLKEKDIRQRLLGAFIMVIGVLLITLF
jgi:uncharacterized membrane protein